MAVASFNSAVAARTRAAAQILGTPELLSLYEELGGLKRDLEAIVKAGNDAEAANLGQSQSKAAGAAVTLDVLANFASLQKEYGAVMAVVEAVRAGLAAKGALAETIAKTDAIIKNEAELTITTFEKDGATARKARRLKAQEALRAEIAKDAAALIDLADIHQDLAERRVDMARLQALKAAAEKLSGLLAIRAAVKGSGKTATKEERDAVARQRDAWAACYRILRLLGERDSRVGSLLKDAAR